MHLCVAKVDPGTNQHPCMHGWHQGDVQCVVVFWWTASPSARGILAIWSDPAGEHCGHTWKAGTWRLRRHTRTVSASTIRPPDPARQQLHARRYVHVRTPFLDNPDPVRSTSTCGVTRSSAGRPNVPANRRPAHHLRILHGLRTGAMQGGRYTSTSSIRACSQGSEDRSNHKSERRAASIDSTFCTDTSTSSRTSTPSCMTTSRQKNKFFVEHIYEKLRRHAPSTLQAGVESVQFFIDFFGTTRHRHPVVTRDSSERCIIVDALLQRQHFIAKVFINVVFTNIIVDTPPPPRSQDGQLASSDRLVYKTGP